MRIHLAWMALAVAACGSSPITPADGPTDGPVGEPADLSVPPSPTDLGAPDDGPVVTPPDMTVAVYTPSHVTSAVFDVNAIAPIKLTGINTTTLTVAFNGGSTFAAPPAGITLTDNGGNAVLTVGAWTVDADVTVTGTRKLIVLAAGPVSISNRIFANGTLKVPGPGGGAPGAGASFGKSGTLYAGDTASGGGGGGGFGTVGGAGGDDSCVVESDPAGSCGGAGGAKITPTLQSFAAGSGGGSGPTTAYSDGGSGGAGGGGIQISSLVSINVTSGGIHAGGGGGGTAHGHAGGGGGGSGGEIFLEAPAITIPATGTLAANGGGASGGGIGPPGAPYGSADGTAGSDANFGVSAAGNGAAKSTAAGNGAASISGGAAAGGGGGGVGVIYVRTRGASGLTLDASNISPAAHTDTTL